MLIPIVWCCGRLICCHALRRRGPKSLPNPRQSSVFHPPPSQGYNPAPQPPPYEPPKNAKTDISNQGNTSLQTPQPLPGNARDNHHDEDMELGRLDASHAPNASIIAHQEPTPMARLSPINTRNPVGSLYRPHDSLQFPLSPRKMSHSSLHGSDDSLYRRHDSLQHRHNSMNASHNSLHVQNPFNDSLATDYPSHGYRPSSPPRPYSPYSPQRPYSPYSPYPPVSPYMTSTTKYESSMFVEHQQPYRAYSPSVSTHYEPSMWNEPVELPSPYNKRPASLIFAQGSQTQPVENKPTSDTLLVHSQKQPAGRASPTQPEIKDTPVQEQELEPKKPSPKISLGAQPDINLVNGSAPPPVRTPTPGRAL